jgi:hypothetical protein
VSFKRQVPLLGYIVDFYASEVELVVEVAGITPSGLRSMPSGSDGENARGNCPSLLTARCRDWLSKDACTNIRRVRNHFLWPGRGNIAVYL